MRHRLLLAAFFMLLSTIHLAAQERCHYTPADSAEVALLLKSGHTDLLYYARHFMGRPYVAHTLELYPDDERLVLNMQELDCTTYVDVLAALTLCARRAQTAFSDFVHQLHQQRYWNGECHDYTSRIHYFSDWIRDNSRLGFASEVQRPDPPFTAVQTVRVGYMSTHPDQYEALKRHPEYLPAIGRQEADLSGRKFRYIPTAELKNTSAVRQAVHDGDIICIVTMAAGLDIAHLGIAVWHDDGLYMIDASSIHKKVVEESIPLRTYLQRRRNAIGIRVVRLSQD